MSRFEMKKARLWMLCWSLVVLPVMADVQADEFRAVNYRSYVTDPVARDVGDIVTLLIIESSEARTNEDASIDKDIRLDGDYDVDGDGKSATIGAGFGSSSGEVTGRSGRLTAQVSVPILQVDPQGKFYVKGEQLITVNGREQLISVEGWLRPIDLDSNNVAVSTRLSDVRITYDGVNKKPNIFQKLFGWIGAD